MGQQDQGDVPVRVLWAGAISVGDEVRFGLRLALILHHDDAEREFAYDREFRLSPLVEALDHAADYGITLVSMRNDWTKMS